MKYYYEGNLNLSENKREANGVTYYIRGVREADGARYERYAVNTHFIEEGENLACLLKKYVMPLYKSGDIVVIGEKAVSISENRTVKMEDLHLSFWAKALSKFASSGRQGDGVSEPHKMQLAINIKGLPCILFAAVCGGIARIFGKRGVFYKIAGREVAGLDGFYTHSAFPKYRTTAILKPKNPQIVCNNLYRELNISCMIADANDIDVELTAKSPDLINTPDSTLCEIIRDNPAGQDDELTPFIIIRDIGNEEAEPYKPPKAMTKI